MKHKLLRWLNTAADWLAEGVILLTIVVLGSVTLGVIYLTVLARTFSFDRANEALDNVPNDIITVVGPDFEFDLA